MQNPTGQPDEIHLVFDGESTQTLVLPNVRVDSVIDHCHTVEVLLLVRIYDPLDLIDERVEPGGASNCP